MTVDVSAICFTHLLADLERMQCASDPRTLVRLFKHRIDLLDQSLVSGLLSIGDPKHGRTLLHEACGRGLLDLAVFLLDIGSDVEAVDIHRDRPVHRAARFDRVNLLKLLQERGADLNAGGQDGNTALHTAVSCNRRAAFDFLVEQPTVNLDLLNNLNQSIEQCAAASKFARTNYELREQRGVAENSNSEKSDNSLKRKLPETIQVSTSSIADKRANITDDKYRTLSGDYVHSLAELCIANWLTAKSIPFIIRHSSSFYLPEMDIEVKYLAAHKQHLISDQSLVISDIDLKDLDKSLGSMI